MNFALYKVAKNNRTSVTRLILELENNMLFELVGMVCIRIIKGNHMKISKNIWHIYNHLCSLSNHPCKQLP